MEFSYTEQVIIFETFFIDEIKILESQTLLLNNFHLHAPSVTTLGVFLFFNSILMKTNTPHVIATKHLSCKNRSFYLSPGALIFLKNASLPMIQWLGEVYTNDSEALKGNTDILINLLEQPSNRKKESKTLKARRKVKKQLYFKLRP